MAADNADDQVASYIVSTLAAWAGDEDFALAELQTVSEPPYEPSERSAGGGLKPFEVIQFVAALQRKELESALRRDRKPSALSPARDLSHEQKPARRVAEEAAGSDLVVTTHMRGVIRAVALAEYELRAFLTDLSWEGELLRRAAVLSKVGETTNDDLQTHAADAGPPDSIGGQWVERGGELFQVVSVSEFGLVRVRGYWVAQTQESWPSIRKAFAQTLSNIDPEAPIA